MFPYFGYPMQMPGNSGPSSADEMLKMAKVMRYMERKDEAKTRKKDEDKKKKEDEEKNKKKKIEIPKIDIIRGALILCIFSPFVGPWVLSLQVSSFNRIIEIFHNLAK